MRIPSLVLSLTLALVAAACSSSKAESKPAPRPVEEQAEEILRLAGVDIFVGQILPSMEQQFQRSAGAQAAPAQQRAVEAMREGFSPAVLVPDVHKAFLAQADRAKLEGVLAWLHSPLGERLSRAENESSSPDRQGEKQAYLSALMANPPSSARVALVQQVDQATGTTDFVVESVAASFKPLLLAEAVRRQGLTPSSYDDVNRALTQLKAEARPKMAPGVFQQLLFAYRSFSDDDLRQYLEFCHTPTGKWFFQAVQQAVVQALEAGGQRFVNKISMGDGGPA